MGYTTEFEGQAKIEPPLTPTMVRRFNEYADERHDYEGPTNHAIWCDWRATEDGTAIEWNGAEKFYNAAEWMAWMIGRFIPENRTVNGDIIAEGEEHGDRWILSVTDREVSVHAVVMTKAPEGSVIDPAKLGPNPQR